MTPLLKRSLLVVAAIAAAAEGIVVFQQWPAPPVKVCASIELGELLAAAAKADAELHVARTHLRTSPDDATPKEVMTAETVSAAAWNAVNDYKQRAQEQQKASGAAGRSATCS